MNQRLNTILFIAAVFLFFGLSWFADRGEAVSAQEQRALAAWPEFTMDSLFTGAFARGLESYFADRFTFRKAFIAQGTRLQTLRGLPEEDEVTLVTTQGNNMHQTQGGDEKPEGEKPPASADAGESDAPAAPAPPKAVEEPSSQQGNYLVVGNRAMIVYYYTPQAAKQYADTLNAFAEKTDGKYNVSAMIVPSSIAFLQNEKYKKLSPPQLPAIKHAAEHLDDGVRLVPVYEALEARSADEYIYFRSDHHWTALGAYYGYAAFAETAGFEPLPAESFEWEELGEFLGTTHAATRSESVAADPDLLTVPRPPIPHTYEKIQNGKAIPAKLIDSETLGYAAFLGGDAALSVVKTKQESGRKLLVFKDSYANAMIPFLVPHYDEIHIIDLRHYAGDVYGYMEKQNIDDILFLNTIDVTSHPGYTRIVADKLDLDVEEPAYR